jgi:uncharacterized RDD family membrane protein YckC
MLLGEIRFCQSKAILVNNSLLACLLLSIQNNMEKLYSTVKGRTYFLGLVTLFLLSEIFFAYLLAESGENDLSGIFFTAVFFLTFFFLTYKGYTWAKWILSILLMLLGMIILLTGFEKENLWWKLLAVSYLYTGAILHFSNNLRTFFQVQRSGRSVGIASAVADQEIVLPESPVTDEGPVTAGSNEKYPALLRRVQSTMIDVVLLFMVLLVIYKGIDLLGDVPVFVKIILLLLLVSYELVMTSQSATLGQWIMGVRVRDYETRQGNIPLGRSYLRSLTKLALGWLSYLTIYSNREKRAIHDMAANSVMVNVSR